VACGVDGLFLEVHPEPEKALCDAASMLPLSEAAGLLRQISEIERVMRDLARGSTDEEG
jgi:2-dehydro-3-deoxyphosphooctonate aldolase (KDO 8-P synthase)